MLQDTMTLNILIAKLQALQTLHGDVPAWIDDADTGWALGIHSITFHARGESKEYGPSVYIAGSYAPYKTALVETLGGMSKKLTPG